MSLYIEIVLIQLFVFTAGIGTIFYLGRIPSPEAFAKQERTFKVLHLLLGLGIWFIGYWFFPNLSYVLGTGWFLAVFVTLFLLLYTHMDLRFAVGVSLIGSVSAVFFTVLLDNILVNDFLILASIVGVVSLFVTYSTLSLKWVMILSCMFLLYDVIFVLFLSDTAQAVLDVAGSTAFKNVITFGKFQLGSGDVFLILFYTAWFFRRYKVRAALLAIAFFVLPLVLLPFVFSREFLVPYSVFIVPIFFLLEGLYGRVFNR